MPKIAIIYTGEIRTIESTIGLFKSNVVKTDDYHVFSVLQHTHKNDNYYDSLIHGVLCNNLKSINWIDKQHATWCEIREDLLKNINIDERWKNYLRNSGSMIEYYQSYLAFTKIKQYEIDNNIRYDFILRFRTDTVLKDPINFDMSIYTKEFIRELLFNLKAKMNSDHIYDKDVVEAFMNHFMIMNRYKYTDFFIRNIARSDSFLKILTSLNDEDCIHHLYNYLHYDGSYIITLRENVIYFIKRVDYEKISNLGITFGRRFDLDSIWFNAESQLKAICLENNIDYFSSTSIKEDDSLYKYDQNNYYDANGELNNGEYSFFIKRK